MPYSQEFNLNNVKLSTQCTDTWCDLELLSYLEQNVIKCKRDRFSTEKAPELHDERSESI